ncbi:MAG: N-methylhydantoinase B [Hyphococcus sp.]|nr:MAG: N-methylhydantoinase B [Marinicaulis sp.]
MSSTEQTSAGLNQIHMQIMWNRLLGVVEEQAQTLIRTAFSPTVREAGDLSAGIFDLEGRMLAQAVTGTPGHVNAMAASVGFFIEKFPVAKLEPGDVLVTNDPWHGTGHLNDFTVVTPTFQDGRCVALFASTTHVADVGGLGFGPDGRQVFEEGLNIPMNYLFRRGEVNATMIEILKANVRDPFVAEGDLYSLAACNQTGGARLLEMMTEFDLSGVDSVGALIIENSRQAMLAEISKLKFGVYENAMRIDGYDDPIDLVCKLTISETGIDVDFSGTSPVSDRGINVPLTYTQAYASFGVRCVIGGDVPNNAGSLSVIRVKAPEGCILNAPRPCAVSARHAVGQMLPDVVLGCLEKAGLDVPAEGTSCLFNPVFLGGAGVVAGDDPGPSFVINPFYNGGAGARAMKDGLSTTAFPSGVKNTPTEINETTAPLIIWRKEYRPNSAGNGKYRGGLGQVLEFSHADGKPFAVSKMFDRITYPPRGRKGGEAGEAGRVYLKGGVSLRGMGRETIPAGAHLVIETPGGGGIGNPSNRDKEAIATDRRDGLTVEDE